MSNTGVSIFRFCDYGLNDDLSIKRNDVYIFSCMKGLGANHTHNQCQLVVYFYAQGFLSCVCFGDFFFIMPAHIYSVFLFFSSANTRVIHTLYFHVNDFDVDSLFLRLIFFARQNLKTSKVGTPVVGFPQLLSVSRGCGHGGASTRPHIQLLSQHENPTSISHNRG